MSESSERYLTQAITTVAQSDPLIKLLRQVQTGRMQPTDAGLRAITESWLGTYQQVIEKGEALDRAGLRRLDPNPRLEVLVETGVVGSDHPAVAGLRAAYEQALARAAG